MRRLLTIIVLALFITTLAAGTCLAGKRVEGKQDGQTTFKVKHHQLKSPPLRSLLKSINRVLVTYFSFYLPLEVDDGDTSEPQLEGSGSTGDLTRPVDVTDDTGWDEQIK